MLLDHLDGRPSEVDAINGAIPPEGEKCGVDAPFNSSNRGFNLSNCG
jgi:ketopantoate reductase